ncbi:MAG: tetratricopeptide repeat protein [Spirochaetales bacterium]|nr:tetratricopeptide repeat protein [Spirochaetales bacterium]
MSNRRIIRIIYIIVLLSLITACGGEKSTWVENLSAAEKKEFKSGDIPEERIENLKKGISFYDQDVERTVKASKQIGIYYRMLALEYMSLEMYNEALKSIEHAVTYFPTSPLLFYYGAVSSAQMSTVVFDDKESDTYLLLAEKYYLRAITLDPGYNEALYGLSVLYIFELNRPLDAEKLLERLVNLSRTHYNAMFLLARVKILRGDLEAAVDLYSRIEENAKDDEVRKKAAANRQKLFEGISDG